MRERVKCLDVDRDDLPVPHEVEQVRHEERRAALVGAAFDDEGRLDLGDRFLQSPHVWH
jgi:hypothetical protein